MINQKWCHLTVTGVLYRESQTCSWRHDRQQNTILISVDNGAGENGHLLYHVEFDKRDIVTEELYADNQALLGKDSDREDIGIFSQDLLNLPHDDNEKAKTDEKIDGLINRCRDNGHKLTLS